MDQSSSLSLKVNVSSIDLEMSLPYQWALLKTYADTIKELRECVSWEKPIHFSIHEATDILEQESLLVERYQLAKLDVLGLSCYTWSTFQQIKLARIVRKVNPGCLIVAGGPDLPYAESDPFKTMPEVDILVKNDGEIPFRRILLRKLSGINRFNDIPGLVVQEAGRAVDTGNPELLKEFPLSPWLQNKELFEESVRELRAKKHAIRITYESNRGCPYGCTYCNWASNTNSKIRCFDLDNIRREIEWMKRMNVDRIFLSDGNLGILARDIEICKWLAELGGKKPCPELILNVAKKHPDRLVEISVELYKAGLLRLFPLGVQSTNADTLKAIGRSNLKVSDHARVANRLQVLGVPIYAQLILGCPGETLDSWKTSIEEMLEIGIDDFQIYRFQILRNTPADSKSYRSTWGIETAKIDRHKTGCIEEYIWTTASFSKNDYIEMEIFFLVLNALLKFETVRKAIALLRLQGQGSYRRLVEEAIEQIEILRKSVSLLREHLQEAYIDNMPTFETKITIEVGQKQKVYPHKYFILRRVFLEGYDDFETGFRRYLLKNYGLNMQESNKRQVFGRELVPILVP